MSSHVMTKKAYGSDKWKECEQCGASYHSKMWFFAGKESSKEPLSCPPNDEWRSESKSIDDCIPWLEGLGIYE